MRSRPDGGQICSLLHAEQVDALAAGHLHRRDVELVDHVGDGAQFGRRGHAAPHARHDRIGAVLLDVGVDALVDEARAGRRRDIRRARRRADSSSAPGGRWGSRPAFFQPSACAHRRDGLQLLRSTIARRTSSWPRVGAFAHRWRLRRLVTAPPSAMREQRLDLAGALSRRRPTPWCGRAPRRAWSSSLAGDRVDDRALADAVAAADLRVVRHGGDGRLGSQARRLSAKARPKISRSRKRATSSPCRASAAKYQAPSATSP